MSRRRFFSQFGLRTAFVSLALLGIGFAFLAKYLRVPPNEISEAALYKLVERVRPGMTVDEISTIFGFDRDRFGSDYQNEDSQWTFHLTDRKGGIHGNSVVYVGKFVSGRLSNGVLLHPM